MSSRLTALLAASALLAAACGDSAASSDNALAEESTSTTTEATTTTVEETSVETTESIVEEVAVEPIEQIRIYHPETLAFAAPFTMIDTEGVLSEAAHQISIETWTTPDILRSLLVNGESEVTAVPSYVGANLYNKDVDVRMAAVVVWGLLWMVGPDGTPVDWENLRGETVMVPFPNDMPDLVFQFLAEANGMTPGIDFEVEYYAQAPEIVGRLVSGQRNFAILPEHVATIALAKANEAGHELGRVFDLQEEWATATGGSARIPQAGIVVPSAIADNPDALGAVLTSLENSVGLVNDTSDETLATLSEASGVPAPMVAQVIPRLNLEVVAGQDAQAELEAFFTELATLSPDIIGGQLPDDGFYLADPR